MVSERNRILRLKEYFESLGIEINIGKNKARGNKGFFRGTKNGNYRIDISKNIDEKEILYVLLHEFAHFVHFKYDKTLSSLDFAFNNMTDTMNEELVNVTVKKIPKTEAKALFDKKDKLTSEIKEMTKQIKQTYPDFKLSSPYKKFERHFSLPVKYLLKYDRINFNNTIYSVENLSKDFYELSHEENLYVKIKSKQRMIGRINGRISKLNRYYNNPTELFARFVELFYFDKNSAERIAPNACKYFKEETIKEFKSLNHILFQ